MMTSASEGSSQTESVVVKKPRPRWTFVMVILGVIAGYAGTTKGSGWSPLLFILFGAVAAPMLGRRFGRNARGSRLWVARFAALIVVGLVSFSAAQLSVHLDPLAAFTSVLATPPPGGVKNIRARKQWYDGQNVAVTFHADQPAIDAILAKRKYRAAETIYGNGLLPDQKWMQVLAGANATMFDRTWVLPEALPASPVRYTSLEDGSGGLHNLFTLVWDSLTGQAIATASYGVD